MQRYHLFGDLMRRLELLGRIFGNRVRPFLAGERGGEEASHLTLALEAPPLSSYQNLTILFNVWMRASSPPVIFII